MDEKCPMCGALPRDKNLESKPKRGKKYLPVFDCGSYMFEDGSMCQTTWCVTRTENIKLKARVAELEAKLPRYADTGKAFVPGRDSACAIVRGQVRHVAYAIFSPTQEKWCWYTWNGTIKEETIGHVYSTKEAALAANPTPETAESEREE